MLRLDRPTPFGQAGVQWVAPAPSGDASLRVGHHLEIVALAGRSGSHVDGQCRRLCRSRRDILVCTSEESIRRCSRPVLHPARQRSSAAPSLDICISVIARQLRRHGYILWWMAVGIICGLAVPAFQRKSRDVAWKLLRIAVLYAARRRTRKLAASRRCPARISDRRLQSRAKRRKRASQAKARSTTHRRPSRASPRAASPPPTQFYDRPPLPGARPCNSDR